MDTAFVVCNLSGVPDLPPFEAMDGGVGLAVRDEKGAIIDGCGYSAVGQVGDNTVAIYRVTTSAETIAAIKADPKRWAVLDDTKPLLAKAVTDMKGGKIEYRTDKFGVVHVIVGKKSFEAEQLVGNYSEVLGEIIRAKPAAAKGKYLRTITMTSTMGPGIPLDTSKTRGLVEDEA